MNGLHCARKGVGAHDDRNPDLTGGNHLDVDSCIRERCEQLSGDTSVGAHSCTNDGEATNLVVVNQGLKTGLLPCCFQGGNSLLAVFFGQRERNISAAAVGHGHVLDNHVDVGTSPGDNREDASGFTGNVRDTHNGNLCLTGIASNSGNNWLFHVLSLAGIRNPGS